jgi:hypothetical protein
MLDLGISILEVRGEKTKSIKYIYICEIRTSKNSECKDCCLL